MNVLLLSAGGPAGVNYLKALRLGGISSVYGADSNPYHIPFCEKYTIQSFLIPKARETEYIEKINAIIERCDIDFVHAQSDIEVRALSDNREKIKAKTFLPPKRVIHKCQDKFETALLWSNTWEDVLGHVITITNKHVKEYLKELIDWHGTVWIRAITGAGGRCSTPCNSVEMGVAWLNYWWARNQYTTFIIQKNLSGRNIAWQSIWYNGDLITSQARERVEYIYPNLAPSGVTGTPAVQRTINEDKINEAAIKAVHRITYKPHGIFSVDLKENEKGEPIPTEINAGRFFTTSYFFAYAGQMFDLEGTNMPLIYTKIGCGEEMYFDRTVNVLPEDLYWIRHIDCGHKITTKDCLLL